MVNSPYGSWLLNIFPSFSPSLFHDSPTILQDGTQLLAYQSYLRTELASFSGHGLVDIQGSATIHSIQGRGLDWRILSALP